MDIVKDIERLKLQQERLQFPAFNPTVAWNIGLELKSAGEKRKAPIVVDIQLWSMPLLSFALPGGAPENYDWVRRKRNIVQLMHKSSYLVGRLLAHDKKSLNDLGALPERDYAVHGGSFPILLKDTGCIGAATVSGLPQREDHNMVIDAFAKVLGVDLGEAALD